MKYVSLFSGIGGFETALNRLGFECVLASEIDKFANLAYKTIYGFETSGDVTKIDSKDIPDHDLLVAGFPCQAFSVAGKSRGFEDTRGTLFFEIARILAAKKPKLFLLENVKGLLSNNQGETFRTIIQTLSNLGYTVDFSILNSKYFGVPQSRERVFIIGILGHAEEKYEINGKDILNKTKSKFNQDDSVKKFNFSWPIQSEVKKKLADVLEESPGKQFYINEEKTKKLLEELPKSSNSQLSDGSGISYCLDANYHKGISTLTKSRRTHILEVLPVLTPERLNRRQKGRRFKTNGEPSFTITAIDRHGVAIGEYTRYRIRRLTPLECMRLQGFPDSYYYKMKEVGISDTQIYKMAGNAVTVNVVEAIGKELIRFVNFRDKETG